MTWWLSPVSATDDGPRLERAHADWIWPQAQGRLGAALQQIGENGRYELIGLLNRGGQAYLWAALDHAADDALVVVKTVNPRSGDPVDSARLTREARLLELLAGEPTVMSILDWGPGRLRGLDHGEFETDRPWLVLPYRAHLSLDRAIALSGGRLSPEAAWQIGRDLGTALDHLHRAQVVHRDLSLRNVLLTPTGAVLADLGMAWAASMVDQTVEQRFTTGITNHSRGVTWGWLAPEAARPPSADGRPPSADGRPDRDPAADVFGWGLHVFGAATGRHPWAAAGLQPSEDELYAMYEQGTEPSLTGLDRPELPVPFRHLIASTLATDPRARPSSAEVLQQLGDRPSVRAERARLAMAKSAGRASALLAQSARPASGPGEDVDVSGPGAGSGIEPEPSPLSRFPSLSRFPARTRRVAALLTLVTVLALLGFGGMQARGRLADPTQARDFAAAFPVALRTQLAIDAEAAVPLTDPAASRVRARKVTDTLMAQLRTGLAGLQEVDPDPAEVPLPDTLDRLRRDLPDLRSAIDRLAAFVDAKDPVSVTVAQAQLSSLVTSRLDDARELSRRLAAGMADRADDRAAHDQADVARATVEVASANAELKTLALSVITKQQVMNLSRFGTLNELNQRQSVQLQIIGERIDPAVRSRLLALRNNDPAFGDWMLSLTEALNRPETNVGQPRYWVRLMDSRLSMVHALGQDEAQLYQEGAENRLRRNEIQLLLGLVLGLVVLFGLALWWWAGRESPHSGGETAVIADVPEDSPTPVAVGAGDV